MFRLGIIELLIIVIGVVGLIFWIAMLVEAATREPDTGNERLIWILIIVFTHLIGAAIYFFVRRPVRIAKYGR